MVQQELGIIYATLQRHDPTLWQTIGLDANTLIRISDQHLHTGSQEALIWYRTAAALDPGRDMGLRLDFAAALANVLLDEAQIPGLVHRLEEGVLQISGTELRWLVDRPQHNMMLGMPLRPNRDATARIWWTDHVGLLVQITQPGTYRLSMQARHVVPLPIKMALGVNGQQLQRFSLERGDASAEIVSVQTPLEPGVHLIGVWFLMLW